MGSPRTVSRFISAPVQTPSTPGTGTGGGTGGGTTSVVKVDRYLGTLGSAANEPTLPKNDVSAGTSAIASVQQQTLLTNQVPTLLYINEGLGIAADYELGLLFATTKDGQIEAIRFYKDSNETGTHVGRIWSGAGVLLASTNFTNETASGWQQQALTSPLTITANTTYVVSVNVNTHYVSTRGGLSIAISNGDITSIANGANGLFSETPGAFPDRSFQDQNYFRDIVFTASTPVTNIPGSLSISGKLLTGQTLTANLTDKTGLRGTISYQWEQSDDGTTWTAIAGATNQTITLAQAQTGKQIRVKAQYNSTVGASKFPNYTTFPAAEKYDWVRITANAIINGVSVSAGQTWICNAKTEKDLPENWEVRSKAISPEMFGDEDSALYLGSLGLEADKPTDAKRPHFTEFPAANAGDWIQVLSTYKTADFEFYRNFPVNAGENWMCLEDNTPVENPEKWERVSARPKSGIFEQLGYFFVGRYDFFEVPSSDRASYVSFNKGVPGRNIQNYSAGSAPSPVLYFEFVDITLWKNYAAAYDIGFSYIDWQFIVVFEKDATGDRAVNLTYITKLKDSDPLDRFNSDDFLDRQTIKSVRDDETIIRINSDKFSIPWRAPPTPTAILTHGIGLSVSQNSGVPLKIKRLQLVLSFYRKN